MNGNGLLEPWRERVTALEMRERRLREQVEENKRENGGVLDIGSTLELIQCRLDISLLGVSAANNDDEATRRVSRAARAAVDLLHALSSQVEAAAGTLAEYEEYQQIRDSIETLLLRGGAGLFSDSPVEAALSGRLSSVVAEAIAKYAPRDDDYEPLFKAERVGRTFRTLLRRIVPFSIASASEGPPYGIEISETQTTPTIALPISQAIHFYEHEVLPMLDASGDEKRRGRVAGLIEELRSISVRPRARPLVAARDFYTEGLTRFTVDGEPLIPVSLEAVYATGTNLDRFVELVRDEVTRRIAGRGWYPPIDEELERLRSLESGREGSRLFPTSKLDTTRWYGRLRDRFFQLRVLEDPRACAVLLDLARGGKQKQLRRSVRKLFSASTSARGTPGISAPIEN